MLDKPAGSACASCPLRDAPLLAPAPASRKDNKTRLVIVGEKPTREDFNKDGIFESQGARLLERGLKTLGISRADVHWTNAILCECPKEMHTEALKACNKRLHDELAAAQAPAVLPVGALALRAVLKPRKGGIADWRGSISALTWRLETKKKRGALPETHAFPYDVTQEAAKGAKSENFDMPTLAESGVSFSWVLPTLHPFFVKNQPELGMLLEIDFARLGRVLTDGWCSPEHDPARTLITDNIDALDLLTEREIAADTETTMALSAMHAEMLCFVLSDTRTSVVIPWSQDMLGKRPWWPAPEKVAKHVTLFLRNKVAIGHNLAYDIPVFARYGIQVADFDDTILGSNVLYSHLPKSLRFVTSLYLDVPPWKYYDNRGDIRLLHEYNHRDGVFNILAWHAQKEELFA